MRLTLRNRFLVPTIAAIVLGTCILTSVSFFKSSSAIRKSTEAQLTLLLDSTRKSIDWTVDNLKFLVNDWRADKLLVSAAESKPEDPEAKSACGRLATLQKNYPYFERISVLDKQGQVIASSDPGALKLNYGDRSYFKEALAGHANVSDYVIGKATGSPNVAIVAPVRDGERIVGVVSAILSLAYLSDAFVDPVKLGEKGYAFMYGSDGLVLAHPDKSMKFKFKMNEADFGRQMMANKQGMLGYSIKGSERITAYGPLKEMHVTVCIVADVEEILAPIQNIKWINLVLSASIVLITGLIIFFVARSVVNPIGKTAATLKDAADQVTFGSNAVSAASQQLAEGASQQAASIEETSSSLEEMASMTKQNAGNASTANRYMTSTKQMVGHANDSMTSLTVSMEKISSTSDETQKIIKTIDEIAFQTNLLALNAAVEAARAGEAGAGFAVVADEVRNLALRAAEAAKNTANLIEGNAGMIKEGNELVKRANDAFHAVAENAEKAGGLVEEIASASAEQAHGIEQISRAVLDMDKVTQQNSMGAEESASASEEMTAQAEQMKMQVADLVALVGGKNGKGNSPSSGYQTEQAGRGNRFSLQPKKLLARSDEQNANGSAHAVSSVGKKINAAKVIPLIESDCDDF